MCNLLADEVPQLIPAKQCKCPTRLLGQDMSHKPCRSSILWLILRMGEEKSRKMLSLAQLHMKLPAGAELGNIVFNPGVIFASWTAAYIRQHFGFFIGYVGVQNTLATWMVCWRSWRFIWTIIETSSMQVNICLVLFIIT